MIKSLEIKDYALIEHIEVNFFENLNIITGETGAGKSILIDALGLILGDRASSEIVRKGASKSFVEGIFEVTNNIQVKKFLEENQIDFQNQLIIRREISNKGNNRCFINDTPVPLHLIKLLGDLLVDLHGQHEHQSLLRTDTHINFLDSYSGNLPILNDYSALYLSLKEKQKELSNLLLKEKSIKEKKEFYLFQLNEIDAINPQPNEDVILNNELRVLENAEKLFQLGEEIYNILYEAEDAIIDKLSEIKNKLNKLLSIDNSLSESIKEFESASVILNEFAYTIRQYKNKLNIDPATIESKRERLNTLNLLKKKYGVSIESVLEYRSKIAREIELAENFDSELDKIRKEIHYFINNLSELAIKLSDIRKKNVIIIEDEVKSVLKNLGIAHPCFEIRFTKVESDDFFEKNGKKYYFNSKGIDNVEFFISTNPGEDPKPLIKVASGGEISRIMLALKTALAKNDRIPVLIFDEIDTGISGRIAQKVGKALFELAKYHQIIAITHLPQIAAYSSHHFVVEKIQSDGRAISKIRHLSEEEHIIEVAKLISGENITESSIESAKELINSK